MVFNLYLLATLYTNTMGLIILAKCNPIINRELEAKGYRVREKDDTEVVINILITILKFLITGYYLKKALELSAKDFDLEKIIKDKINSGEIETDELNPEVKLDDSIFRDERRMALSSGKYERQVPYKANTMYTKDRYPNRDEVDVSFWEEENKAIASYVVEEVPVEASVIRSPLEEYIAKMNPDQLETIVSQLEMIQKLKKQNDNMLNKAS